MPSFAQTTFFSLAVAVASVAASPVAAAIAPATLAARDVDVCWGPKSNGTDHGWAAQGFCGYNVHKEASYAAPVALIGNGVSVNVTTKTHLTYGPLHCCNTCRPDQGCIGWQINSNCECVRWYAGATIPTDVNFGVHGGPYTNKSGKFHPVPNINAVFLGNATTA
ncbi:hypothetical protein DRE_00895 [Drechslerella stenobrocha 248]|uniref:Uncharacterized protein n=1 Tax=Drechslerella stenobrocha 248 TaxID=1043628 RepID=W7HNA2_9PEZI|nr:hypothetical protein DRE_00895 [Drechslerella stenobrocha 248]